jgi:hypothetical protein
MLSILPTRTLKLHPLVDFPVFKIAELLVDMTNFRREVLLLAALGAA